MSALHLGSRPAGGMSRGEAAALAAALAGHALLFTLLSLAWGEQAPRVWPTPQPIEVSLVKEVALEATAPPAPTPPAPSIAPDVGAPEDAAPAPQPVAKPAPPPPVPAKVEPAPAPRPAPAPKPVAAAKPPLPSAAAKPVAARPASSRLANLPAAIAAGAKADAAARPRGHRLGADFLAGLSADATSTKASPAAPAAKAGPFPTASIVQAIARQIQPCADRQVNPGPGANRIVTTLAIRLSADGSLSATPRMVRQGGLDNENERYAQRVVDLGIAAFKGCTPLHLPADYYSTPAGGWNAINYQWQLR